MNRLCQRLEATGFSPWSSFTDNKGCPKDCGNLSFRTIDDFVITPVCASLGDLKPKDFVLVRDVDIEGKKVFVVGKSDPSSEAMMHFLIYGVCQEISVILHAHALDLKNAVTTKKLTLMERWNPPGLRWKF